MPYPVLSHDHGERVLALSREDRRRAGPSSARSHAARRCGTENVGLRAGADPATTVHELAPPARPAQRSASTVEADVQTSDRAELSRTPTPPEANRSADVQPWYEQAPPPHVIGRPTPADCFADEVASPPNDWREHWFEHRQLLSLHRHDEHAAIYLDPDVNRNGASWLLSFISQTWQYSKAIYGDSFGPDPRLYSVHHTGRYSGGHPGYYFDALHDYRNVSDCGPGTWTESDSGSRDLPAHEIAHVVESANNGSHGSPAFGIWGDSKWAEFYVYDLYAGLGMRKDQQRLYTTLLKVVDDFPRGGTHWFRDWFYPLWQDSGQAQVMARFFRLLAQHFPTDDGGRYLRDLNWGEYLHFTSCAAGGDLRKLATRAFGWPQGWSRQFEYARNEFPLIKY
jgi:hypothetical protein